MFWGRFCYISLQIDLTFNIYRFNIIEKQDLGQILEQISIKRCILLFVDFDLQFDCLLS